MNSHLTLRNNSFRISYFYNHFGLFNNTFSRQSWTPRSRELIYLARPLYDSRYSYPNPVQSTAGVFTESLFRVILALWKKEIDDPMKIAWAYWSCAVAVAHESCRIAVYEHLRSTLYSITKRWHVLCDRSLLDLTKQIGQHTQVTNKNLWAV